MTANDTSLDIELKDLSEKIRQYLSLEPEGENYYDSAEWNFLPKPLKDSFTEKDKATYINLRNLALEIKQKYPGLTKLHYEPNPIIGLQDLWEWCIDNIGEQKPIETRGGKAHLLNEKTAETGQNAVLAKVRKLWNLVRRIPRWIYVLVLFLAALLGILEKLGCLEPVKAFISKMLSSK